MLLVYDPYRGRHPCFSYINQTFIMNYPTNKFGDTPSWVNAIVYVLSLTGLAVVVSILIVFIASNSQAFSWGDKTASMEASYDEAVSDLVLDEIQLRRSKRQLFNAHCALVEHKITEGIHIIDDKYVKPCREGDQVEYYRLRNGGKPKGSL